MRRIVLAMVVVAFVTVGAMTEPASDEFVIALSAATERLGMANADTKVGPTAGEKVARDGRTLANQYGDEIPVGVQVDPPVAFPGATPSITDTTPHIHVMRNGQLWTVDLPTTRTPNGSSVGPTDDEAINKQLPVMWRCSDAIQSGCWQGPGNPPGNPAIPDRLKP